MTAPAAYPHEIAPGGPQGALAARLQAVVPRLRTGRCELRAPMIEDFQPFAAILQSERARYVDGPFSRADAWLEFAQYTAGWALRGAGLWTIAARDGAAVLGFTSIGMEHGDREHELGYMLTAGAEGRGLAAEAVGAARDHALGALRLPSLVSYIDPGNDRSIRLAERLGARRDDAAAAALDTPVVVYRHALAEASQ